MSNIKHTPWFEGQVKPVRPGVYRTRREPYAHIPSQRARYRFRHRFAFFDGTHWYPGYESVEDAWRKGVEHAQIQNYGAYQDLEWQGLTEAEAKRLEAEVAALRAETLAQEGATCS